MNGKIKDMEFKTYFDELGVMHYDCIPYFTESEIFDDLKMELVDCIEGNLVDNYLCIDKYGNYHFYKEKNLNEWSSTLILASRDCKTNDEVWAMWENFQNLVESQEA